LGKGTSFIVRLPIAPNLVAEADKPGPEPVSPRASVLIVDDEAVLRSLERILRAEHNVVTESDLRAALARVEGGQRFDVILCDLMMPYLTGPELFRAAIALEPALARRFVFMTGGVLRTGIDLFLSEVANECLEKPIALQNLRSAVRRMLASSLDAPAIPTT